MIWANEDLLRPPWSRPLPVVPGGEVSRTVLSLNARKERRRRRRRLNRSVWGDWVLEFREGVARRGDYWIRSAAAAAGWEKQKGIILSPIALHWCWAFHSRGTSELVGSIPTRRHIVNRIVCLLCLCKPREQNNQKWQPPIDIFCYWQTKRKKSLSDAVDWLRRHFSLSRSCQKVQTDEYTIALLLETTAHFFLDTALLLYRVKARHTWLINRQCVCIRRLDDWEGENGKKRERVPMIGDLQGKKRAMM